MSITQAHAETAIAAACRAANEIGVPMNIAVFDDAANLKAFARMDGAQLGSLDIALGKARTAALFGFNTEGSANSANPVARRPASRTRTADWSSLPAAFRSTGRTVG